MGIFYYNKKYLQTALKRNAAQSLYSIIKNLTLSISIMKTIIFFPRKLP